MIKEYLLFSAFTITLILLVLFNIATKDKQVQKSQIAFTKLTTIIEPSLSSSIIEDRFLYLTKNINRIYPLMPKIDRKGFVYAK